MCFNKKILPLFGMLAFQGRTHGRFEFGLHWEETERMAPDREPDVLEVNMKTQGEIEAAMWTSSQGCSG